jgi:hypothetical protein
MQAAESWHFSAGQNLGTLVPDRSCHLALLSFISLLQHNITLSETAGYTYFSSVNVNV